MIFVKGGDGCNVERGWEWEQVGRIQWMNLGCRVRRDWGGDVGGQGMGEGRGGLSILQELTR